MEMEEVWGQDDRETSAGHRLVARLRLSPDALDPMAQEVRLR